MRMRSEEDGEELEPYKMKTMARAFTHTLLSLETIL